MIENAFPHADEAIENAKATGNAYWKKAKTQGKNIWNGTQNFVEKKPFQAVGYAVLLGVALGALFSITNGKK